MHVAATRLMATSGGGQSLGKKACSTYVAKVKAVMAFPVGRTTTTATHRYRKEGKLPYASLM